MRAVEYLVAMSEVRTQTRVTPKDVEEPMEQDRLYSCGIPSAACTLVLQGRVCVMVGRDKFRSEAGAFAILAKDALVQDGYHPDFSAHLSTAEVRLLIIPGSRYSVARSLDKDVEALQEACSKLAITSEFSRREACEGCSHATYAPGLPSLLTSRTEPSRAEPKTARLTSPVDERVRSL